MEQIPFESELEEALRLARAKETDRLQAEARIGRIALRVGVPVAAFLVLALAASLVWGVGHVGASSQLVIESPTTFPSASDNRYYSAPPEGLTTKLSAADAIDRVMASFPYPVSSAQATLALYTYTDPNDPSQNLDHVPVWLVGLHHVCMPNLNPGIYTNFSPTPIPALSSGISCANEVGEVIDANTGQHYATGGGPEPTMVPWVCPRFG